MWEPNPGLDYQGMIIRPPSEAGSIILQATLGCSHGKCAFCATYQGKRFALKDEALVERDVLRAARLYPHHHRLFVADGDALVMPMKRWLWLLDLIATHLPGVGRVGAYATGKSVRLKSDEELRLLREKGLGILYLGVESGDDETLAYVGKDSTSDELVEAGKRIMAAGIKLSITVLLGIAPRGRSREHAAATGELISRMDPDYVGCLSVMVCEGTELARKVAAGEHSLPDARGYLEELKVMLEHTEMSRGLFMSNHASNYLPLKIRMPRGREAAIASIEEALSDTSMLRPESWRLL